MLPLSVLDLSFVTTAAPGSVAINNTIDLARLVDRLGFTRFWVAEHHNLPSVASGAPEIMIGAIAAATSRIRVGSGGVMLPNHSPLMVAERFKVLEALYPGRIDLGIGRAPGTDAITSWALRRRQDVRADDDFLERFQELYYWKTEGWPDGHRFASIKVMPEDVAVPPIWLLGSSYYSAELAGQVGMGFAFAHHFAQHDAGEAVRRYKSNFRPSAFLDKPHAVLGVSAVCASSDDEADRLASTIDLNSARRSQGLYMPLSSPEEALAHHYSPAEEAARLAGRKRVFTGAERTLKERLTSFAQSVGADELMVTTPIFDHQTRKRSYELLAHAFELADGS